MVIMFCTQHTSAERPKLPTEGVVDAYTLKQLNISGKRLARVASALRTSPRVHEIVELSVIKYWYDCSWSEPQFPDLILVRF